MTNIEKEKVKKFISKHQTATLSVVDENNKPHAAAISIVVDDDLSLYFITKSDTKKYTSIQTNPNVALTITDEVEKATVQIEGIATELKDVDEQAGVMQKLATPHKDEQGVWVPPIAEIKAGKFVVLTIKPSFVRLALFNTDNPEVIEL